MVPTDLKVSSILPIFQMVFLLRNIGKIDETFKSVGTINGVQPT
jgi:hypothetical protein